MTTSAPVKQLPQPGDKLKNGAILLAARSPRGVAGGAYHVVLAVHAGAGAVQPFCVWKVDKNGNAYWGNYHAELHEAVAAFAERH